MDRNNLADLKKRSETQSLSARRAWIEMNSAVNAYAGVPSLSARRAWIEIAAKQKNGGNNTGSLSARRAWIEMTKGAVPWESTLVALRKESVDRNCRKVIIAACACRRSPQGERG